MSKIRKNNNYRLVVEVFDQEVKSGRGRPKWARKFEVSLEDPSGGVVAVTPSRDWDEATAKTEVARVRKALLRRQVDVVWPEQ